MRSCICRKSIPNVLLPRTNWNVVATFASLRVCHAANHQNLEKLEDLTNLESLKDVDPELIKKLINERTSELNIRNELEMLKSLDQEDKSSRESPLKKFIRPLWVFLLMSSSVYLTGHYLWWRLEYSEKELELAQQVKSLEAKLNHILESKDDDSASSHKKGNGSEIRPWYVRWLW